MLIRATAAVAEAPRRHGRASRAQCGAVARPRSPVGPDVRQQRRPLLERLGRVPIRSGIEKPDGLVGPNLRAERRQDLEP